MVIPAHYTQPPKPASDTSTTTTTATTTATARRSNRSVTNTVATAVPVVAAKIQQPLIREKKRTRSGNAKTAQLRSVAAVMQDGDAVGK